MVLLNFHLTIQVLHGILITNCLYLVPALFNFLSRKPDEPKRAAKIATDAFAFFAQLSGCLHWTFIRDTTALLSNSYDFSFIQRQRMLDWTLPVSLILISIGWWENHVDKGAPVGKFSLLFSAIRGMFRYPLNLFSRFYQVFGSNQRKHERDETIYSDICQPVEIIGFCRHDAYFSGRGFHDARRTCVWCYL